MPPSTHKAQCSQNSVVPGSSIPNGAHLFIVSYIVPALTQPSFLYILVLYFLDPFIPKPHFTEDIFTISKTMFSYSSIFLRFWISRSPTSSNRSYSPTVLCQRLTANRRPQVTVTTAGIARCGSVLAATWVTGELEGNFSTMMTSCCICSLNMSGLCGRKHWWRDRAWRRGEREHGEDKGRVRGTEGWREEISMRVVVKKKKREGRMEIGKIVQGRIKDSAKCQVHCPKGL